MTIKWVKQDPLVMNGEPFCYGSRLTVRQLLELRSNVYNLTMILKNHPELRVLGIEVLDQLGETKLCLLDADRLVQPQAARYRDADGEPRHHESAERRRGRSGRDRGPSRQSSTPSDGERALRAGASAPQQAQTITCARCGRSHCAACWLPSVRAPAPQLGYGARIRYPETGQATSLRCPVLAPRACVLRGSVREAELGAKTGRQSRRI